MKFFRPRLNPWQAAFTVFLMACLPLQAQTAADSAAAKKWGYGYTDLLADMQTWRQSPYVHIDSIGASVQGRALWMLTVTEGDTTTKSRIFIHARTHPAEVQAFYVAEAALDFLLGPSDSAAQLRRKHIFHFIPMYNPDGVELGYARENANRIDIESNWNKPSLEPEVVALRAKFSELMATPQKIQVALNLHSDQFNCTRFFFYHDSGGTSPRYTQLEKTFIGDVQKHFEGGFEPWFFVQSWKNGTGTQYPEGWWWTNFQDTVMALTYEDANCPDASAFAQTGQALLMGSSDYIARNGVGIRLARKVKPSTRLKNGAWYMQPGRGEASPNFHITAPTSMRFLLNGRSAGGLEAY